ncbi:MAG TPA: alpha/beta hydrolase-fold protein [Dokdonella sp.]|jgi:predicted alpha/beta superfamily hydrolase|nr:alpha/beta hydrolase-fold protein [Dokdonella sp.]
MNVSTPFCLKFLGVILLLAGFVAPASADDATPVHLTLRVPSRLLSETRVVNVHVPPGYDAKADLRYPVLYMPDGGMKEDFPHLVEAVDALVRAGEIPPMLVVGIENTERRRDMTGPTTVDSDREIAPVVGGSAAFRDFIRSELMPLIQSFYKVNDQQAIIGESLAGLFIVETLFVQPDLFDTYIALDPSLWWNGEQWWREAGSRLDGSQAFHARLLLASAGDSGKVSVHLADALCRNPQAGLDWTYAPRPDLRHANIYRKMEREVLRQAFSGKPLPAPDCAAAALQ